MGTAHHKHGLEEMIVVIMDLMDKVYLQDIAVVPFLVLLPFVESNDLGGESTINLVYELGPTALKTVGSLAILLVVGRLVMRRLFELVAESRSDETFISLCLLTVTGAGLLTQKLGLSDTLGIACHTILQSSNKKAVTRTWLSCKMHYQHLSQNLLDGLPLASCHSRVDLLHFVRWC